MKKKKIVIIDDSYTSLFYMKTILHKYLKVGIDIVDFRSCNDFLKTYLQRIQSADLLILDYLLPGMNGIELATYIRGLGITIPIIFVTASRNYEDFNKILNKNSQLIIKPYKSSDLLQAIEKILIDNG